MISLSNRGCSCAALLIALVPAFAAIASAQTQPSGQTPEETTIALNPFEVVADDTETYQANNTLGVTGTNRNIRTLPITMEAFTKTFIDDIGATNLNEILLFATNVQDTQDSLDGGNGQGHNFRIRGLVSNGERRRNGFLSLLMSDAFNLERAEVLRGPQSLLYGQGVSAGTINTVTKQPVRRDIQEVRFQFDQYESARTTVDINRSFGKLGVRVNGLLARRRFWYDNLFEDTEAYDLALSYKLSPKWTLRGSYYRLEFDGTRRFADDTEIRDNSKPATVPATPNPTFMSFLIPGQEKANDIIIAGAPLTERNAFSIAGAGLGTTRSESDEFIALEGEPFKNLNLRIAVNRSLNDTYNRSQDNSTLNYASQLVVAPTDSAAVADASGVKQYSVMVNPQRTFVYFEVKSLQASAVYSFKVGKLLTSQVVAGGELRDNSTNTGFQGAYETDAQGNILRVTPLNNVNQRTGRIKMGSYFRPITGGYLGDVIGDNPSVASGTKYYTWANVTEPVTPATSAFTDTGYVTDQGPTNVANRTPFGNDPQVLRDQRQKAAYVSWLGTWFKGKLETMAGARTDDVSVVDSQSGTAVELYGVNEKSGLVGLVLNVLPNVGIYANRAKSFTAASALRKDWDGNGLTPSSGFGNEVGLKFDLFDQRISGSIGYYQNSSSNENFQVPAAIRNAIDPVQMGSTNNRYSTQFQAALPFTPVPNYSDGFEVGMSMRPVNRLRISINAGITDGRYTASVNKAIYYNDQFYTRPAGNDTVVQARIVADGVLTAQYADVMVRSVRNNNASELVPLTISMLKAPPSATGYGVTYDAAGNGRVSNFATLFPTAATPPSTTTIPTAAGARVFAAAALPTGTTSGAVLATGTLGLPIAAHQLGFVPNPTGDDPRFVSGTGDYRIFQSGDNTGGYAEQTLTFNSNYSFGEGRLRGFSLGASAQYRRNIRRPGYTQYPDGSRLMLFAPDYYSIGLRAAYARKFRHLHWLSQLNVANALASGGIIYRIDDATGAIVGFNRSSLPAVFTWTNTFNF